jgi:N6-L-threonylcarbamoyladenine synthase
VTSTERLILGIETSCDETAAALVTREGRVRGEALASQVELHARFGGIVPEVAARMHIQACLPIVDEAMRDAGANWNRIEAVAVTRGPGLVGCLLVGVETAKALAWLHGKPLIAVNHLSGHLHSIFVAPKQGAHTMVEGGIENAVVPVGEAEEEEQEKKKSSTITSTNSKTRTKTTTRTIDAGGSGGAEALVARPEYPHVGLIVSGGHTSLLWVEGPDVATTIAETMDDAAGEAYDKVARAAGLGYPGGPAVDRLAAEGNADAFAFTTPMMRRDKPNFSFSGLKTAAGRAMERLRAQNGEAPADQTIKDWCAGFQRAVIASLLGKSLEAARARHARDLVIAGGVACNRGLRGAAAEATRAKAHRGLRVWFPHPSICTDNGAMIAGLAWRIAPLGRAEALALNADASLGF